MAASGGDGDGESGSLPPIDGAPQVRDDGSGSMMMVPEGMDPADFARREWVRRGNDPLKFSLWKFARMQKRDAKEQERQRQNNLPYDDKMELMEDMRASEISVENLQGMLKDAGGAVASGAMDAGKLIYRVVEPEMFKRYRRRNQYMKRIAKLEDGFVQFREDLDWDMEIAQTRKLNAKKKQRDRRSQRRQEKQSDEIRHGVLDKAREEARQMQFDEFHQRYLEKEKKKADAIRGRVLIEQREKSQAEAALREWRVSHWGRLARERGEEAKEARRIQKQMVFDRTTGVRKRTEKEFADRDAAREHLQTEGPAVSESIVMENGLSLGLFNTPMGEGDWAAKVGGGDQPGLDNVEVPLFSGMTDSANEDKHVALQDKQAELGRLEQLHGALQDEKNRLQDAVERTADVKKRMAVDLEELEQQQGVTDREQGGPPRRDASLREVLDSHSRKTRIAELRKKMTTIDTKADNMSERVVAVDAQMLQLAQQIAVLREQTREEEHDLRSQNHGLDQLPVVVGRNISKVEGLADEFTGKPKESFDMVTHQSRLEIMKASSRAVVAMHREGRNLDRKMWNVHAEKNDAAVEVNKSLARLAVAKQRIEAIREQDMKQRIVEALKSFFASCGVFPTTTSVDNVRPNDDVNATSLMTRTLNHVQVHYAGPLMWAQLQIKDKCRNMRKWRGLKVERERREQRMRDHNVRTTRRAEKRHRRMQRQRQRRKRDKQKAAREREHSREREAKRRSAAGLDANNESGKEEEKEEAMAVVDKAEEEDDSDEDEGGTKFSILSEDESDLDEWGEYEPDSEDEDAEDGGGDGNEAKQSATSNSGVVPHAAAVGGGDNNHAGQQSTRSSGGTSTGSSGSAGSKKTPQLDTKQFAVSLAGRSRAGICMGLLQFPRVTLWDVFFRVSKRDPTAIEQGDPQNWVVVKLGSSLNTLSTLAEIKNIRNPECGRIEYDIVHSFYGNQLAYRFDFRNLKEEDPMAQFVIEVGKYEMKVVPPLMDVPNKPGVVLSAYVQQLRIASQQQKSRMMVLLEELIAVEQAGDVDTWDSDVLVVGSMQRYSKEVFLKLIAAEILLEKQSMASDQAAMELNRVDPIMLDERAEERSREEALALKRCRKSLKLYHRRKKLRWRRHVDESLALAGKRVEIFDEDRNRWRHYVVQDCEIEWIENGTKALAKHTVQEFDDAQRDIGGPAVVVLEELRWYEADHVELDEGVRQRWIEAEEERRMLVTIEERAEQTIQRHRDDFVARGDFSEREQYRLYMLEQRIREYAEERQKGVRDDAGRRRLERIGRIQHKLKIQNFEKAVPKAPFCEHMRTKCWGGPYGKGVRCLDCGKELTTMHNEASQRLGYGSGGDPELDRLVQEHARNEGKLRVKTSVQQKRIDDERVRLEKEEREIEMEDGQFYDYEDMRRNYKFDQRHRRELKKAGVIRQGMLWTEDEFNMFVGGRKNRLLERAQELGLVEDVVEEMDPLEGVEEPPPTARAKLLRRKANYRDLMLSVARINQFNCKIAQLKTLKVELIADRVQSSEVLDDLHKKLFWFQDKLQEMEDDMLRARNMMTMLAEMDKLWQQAIEVERNAEQDVKRAEMKQAGIRELAQDAWAAARDVNADTKDLIREKMKYEAIQKQKAAEVAEAKRIVRAATKALEDAEQEYRNMGYRVKGRICRTPYGVLTVRMYREEDGMLVFDLPFGKPRARLYIPLVKCFDMERSAEEGETRAMQEEERLTRKLLEKEQRERHREQRLMAMEEVAMRDIVFHEKAKAAEEERVRQGVLKAVEEAAAHVITKEFKREIAMEADIAVAEEYLQRALLVKDWTGIGKKPKKMGVLEKKRRRKEVREGLKDAYVKTAAQEAERTLRGETSEAQRRQAEIDCMDEVVKEAVKECMAEAAQESIDEGLSAKAKAEEDSGIFFPYPAHMQYAFYVTLREWWKGKRYNVQHELETFQAKMAKELQEMEEQGAAVGDYAEEMKRREEEAKQKKLLEQAALRMYEEECQTREFLKEEMTMNLRERRRMGAEDRLSRQYREELKKLAEEKAQQQKYDVLGGGGAGDGVGAGGQGNRQSGRDADRPSIPGGGGVKTGGRSFVPQNMQSRFQPNAADSNDRKRVMVKMGMHERRQQAKERELMGIEDDLSEKMRRAQARKRRKEKLAEDGSKWGGSSGGGAFSNDLESLAAQEESLTAKNTQGGGGDGTATVSSLGAGGTFALSDPMATTRSSGSGASAKRRQDSDAGSHRSRASRNSGSKRSRRSRQTSKTSSTKQSPDDSSDDEADLSTIASDEEEGDEEEEDARAAEERVLEQKATIHWTRVLNQSKLKLLVATLAWMDAEEARKKCEHEMRKASRNLSRISLYTQQKGEEEMSYKADARAKEKLADKYDLQYRQAFRWLEDCRHRSKHRDKVKRRVDTQCRVMDTKAISGFYQRFETHRLHEKLYELYFQTQAYAIANRAELVATERKLMHIHEHMGTTTVLIADKTEAMNKLWRKFQRDSLLRLRRSELGKRIFRRWRKEILTNVFQGWQKYQLWHKECRLSFNMRYELNKRDRDIDNMFPQLHSIPQRDDSPPPPAPELPRVEGAGKLQQHNQRAVQCRNCKVYYIDAQNHSMICRYHSGDYRHACPRSCTKFTSSCMAHRRRRWTCCDQTDEGRNGSNGCRVRYHMPVEDDPGYKKAMDDMNERDKDIMEALHSDMERLQDRNLVLEAYKLRKSQLDKIEVERQKDRKLVDEFHQIKWV